MEPFTVAVIAVAIDRLLVVVAALISIVLGWNLFVRAITPDQSGSISVGNWKVELKSVGPGVFFSLFGTVVLVYALFKPADYSLNSPIDSSWPQTKTFHVLGVDSAQDTILRSYVRAINTLVELKTQLAAEPKGPPVVLLPQQTEDFETAEGLLEQLRRQFLVAKFGAALLNEWDTYGDAYRNSKQSLSTDVQSDLDKIAPWFTETVVDQQGAAQ